ATASGHGQFATSGSGSLLYAQRSPLASAESRLAWATSSSMTSIAEGVQPSGSAALSPDGRRIAWSASDDPSRADIWVGDLQRGAVTRLTHDGMNVSPTWSPDGRKLYFSERADGRYRPVSIDADGGEPSALPALEHHALAASVSADGSLLAVVQFAADTRGDI